MKGKIYTWGETVAPYPEFRNLASYYRYLTAALASEKGNGKKKIVRPDYPSLDKSTEDPADVALSRKLLEDWDKGDRKDDYLGVTALYLSGVEDSDKWAALLPSMIGRPFDDDDVPYDLVENICGLLEDRQYQVPLATVIQMADDPELTYCAIKILEKRTTPEALKALRVIKKTHNLKGR